MALRKDSNVAEKIQAAKFERERFRKEKEEKQRKKVCWVYVLVLLNFYS